MTVRQILRAWTLLAVIGTAAFAQEGSGGRTRAAYFELGGPGGFYSLNFDAMHAATTWRLGWTSYDGTGIGGQAAHALSAVIGGVAREIPWTPRYAIPGTHVGEYIEAGAAIVAGTHKHNGASGSVVTLVPILGFRSQPGYRAFMYRLTLTPYLPLIGGAAAYPERSPQFGAGGSIGFAF